MSLDLSALNDEQRVAARSYFGDLVVAAILDLIEVADECWMWMGEIGPTGYGRFHIGPRRIAAHRVVFEVFVGPIPDGLTLDHLCRNIGCVRPNHLEPVTHRVNILRGDGLAALNARKTHCDNGHPFSEENTRIAVATDGRTHRHCRACSCDRTRRWRERRRRAA